MLAVNPLSFSVRTTTSATDSRTAATCQKLPEPGSEKAVGGDEGGSTALSAGAVAAEALSGGEPGDCSAAVSVLAGSAAGGSTSLAPLAAGRCSITGAPAASACAFA